MKYSENKPLVFERFKVEQVLEYLNRKGASPAQIIDNIIPQLEEVFFIEHPKLTLQNADNNGIQKFIKSKIDTCNWIYFPWNNLLIRYLSEPLHFELRTARNRNLITQNEQLDYFNSLIGIAGLSVGNSIMGTILHTGGANNWKLADFDSLSGSNINRIRTNFKNIGVKKTEIAAREIYEVNPYSDINLFSEGITLENIDEFLLKPKKLDVLIEEMDNLYLKVQIRILARKYGIPVVMITDNGDNIICDVERYDKDRDRRIFNTDVPEAELLSINQKISKKDAGNLIARLVGISNVAPRMLESLGELGKTLYSWPQLGNAAFLGGCAASYCVRKIVSKQILNDGRYFISLDEIFKM